MPADDPVPALIEKLKSPDKHVRISALEALGQLRDTRALEPMLHLARDKRYEVQHAAGRALGELGDMRAFDTLLQMYNGETYPLISSDGAPHQYDACLSGGAIGLALLYRQTGKVEIFELLTDRFRREFGRSDQSKMPSTVQGLPYTGDRRVAPMLIQAAESSSYWLHYCGLEALGVLGDPAGLPVLYTAVRTGDPLTLVWVAADALALFGVAEADQPLFDGLQRLEREALPKEQFWYKARAKIVRALGIIGTPRARQEFEQRLGAMGDQRTVGSIGLAYMGEKEVLQTLISRLEIGDLETRAAVATAIGVLGDSSAIPALERCLSSRSVIQFEDAVQEAIAKLRQ